MSGPPQWGQVSSVGEAVVFSSAHFSLTVDAESSCRTALIELDDALVGDGDTEDVRGEILAGGQATADGLRMNHPKLVAKLALALAGTNHCGRTVPRNLVRKIGDRALTGTRKSLRDGNQRRS